MSAANERLVEVGTASKTRPNHPAILINIFLRALDGAPVDQANKIRRRGSATVTPVAARLAALRGIDAK